MVGLVNSSGKLVVEYVYDPWGKLLETKIGVAETDSKYTTYNNMALRNPLRYRGYIYDRDTGLYYLQSRYYDPEIGRFINADSYASTDATGLLSTNMFAYCENDPVNKSDPTGEVAPILVAMAGGALVGIAEQFMTDVIYAMVTGQPLDACFSSVGTYVSSAVGGAMSVLPGGGVMRAFSEIILTSYIQETVDMLVYPNQYAKTNPNSEILESAAGSGMSKLGEKGSAKIADKINKTASNMTKHSSKASKNAVKNAASKAGGALKSFGKYFGNIFSIVTRIFD